MSFGFGAPSGGNAARHAAGAYDTPIRLFPRLKLCSNHSSPVTSSFSLKTINSGSGEEI